MLITYTDSMPGTVVDLFPIGASLTNWGGESIRLLESASPNTGRWTASLDPGVYAVFEGGLQPESFGESVGTITVPDVTEGVVVVPVQGTVDRRDTNTQIELFTGETQTVGVSVFDRNGAAVDVSSLALEMSVETSSKTVVCSYSDAELSAVGNTVGFSPKAEMVESPRTLLFAIRDVATKAVVCNGRITVKHAP